MDFWGNTSNSTAIQIGKELPNKDLIYISYEKEIPSVHRGIYFHLSFDENGNIKIEDYSNQIPDPSTIYIHLPISEDYNVDPLPYWPHYIEMTPGQRYKYLCWLRNVEQPIDMGYVFIYYYGLERQLLIGNFDKAFDEIIKLRGAHKNKSFLKYSENALIHGSVLKGRYDKLEDLHEKTEITTYSNALFMMAYKLNIPLGATQLFLILSKVFPTARKAIKENYELFSECLTDSLIKLKNDSAFNISNYDISKTKTVKETRFANYSFAQEIQKETFVDFYQCKELMQDFETLSNEAYSLYKQKKAVQRTNKTPEDIEKAKRKKNENRYKRLFKDKKITLGEFELLINANSNSL